MGMNDANDAIITLLTTAFFLKVTIKFNFNSTNFIHE